MGNEAMLLIAACSFTFLEYTNRQDVLQQHAHYRTWWMVWRLMCRTVAMLALGCAGEASAINACIGSASGMAAWAFIIVEGPLQTI